MKIKLLQHVLAAIGIFLSANVIAVDYKTPDIIDGVAAYGFGKNILTSYIDGLCGIQEAEGVKVDVSRSEYKNEAGIKTGEKTLAMMDSTKSLRDFKLSCKTKNITYCKYNSEEKCDKSEERSTYIMKRVLSIYTGACQRKLTVTISGSSDRKIDYTTVGSDVNEIADEQFLRPPKCSDKTLFSHMKKSGVEIRKMSIDNLKEPSIATLLVVYNKRSPWEKNNDIPLWKQFMKKKDQDELMKEINKYKDKKN